MDVARLGQLYHWFHYPYNEKKKTDMCYYYPDAAKLGGAIMAGEGSTSAPSECFWWQVFLLPIWTSLTGLVLYLGMDLYH